MPFPALLKGFFFDQARTSIQGFLRPQITPMASKDDRQRIDSRNKKPSRSTDTIRLERPREEIQSNDRPSTSKDKESSNDIPAQNANKPFTASASTIPSADDQGSDNTPISSSNNQAESATCKYRYHECIKCGTEYHWEQSQANANPHEEYLLDPAAFHDVFRCRGCPREKRTTCQQCLKARQSTFEQLLGAKEESERLEAQSLDWHKVLHFVGEEMWMVLRDTEDLRNKISPSGIIIIILVLLLIFK